jgi:hypothetical protein
LMSFENFQKCPVRLPEAYGLVSAGGSNDIACCADGDFKYFRTMTAKSE